MNSSQRTTVVLGVLLIIVGLFLAAVQFYPPLRAWIPVAFEWPMIVMLVGAGLFVLGLLVRAPEMAIPACIVGGIGGILYYQNATQDWGSWSYMWALIPGFVSIGMILARLMGGNAGSYRDALGTLLTSAFLFLVFSAFLGGRNWLGAYWPLLLVAWGIYILIKPLFRKNYRVVKGE